MSTPTLVTLFGASMFLAGPIFSFAAGYISRDWPELEFWSRVLAYTLLILSIALSGAGIYTLVTGVTVAIGG